MTSYIAKTAARKFLGKKLQDKFGQGDPYYEKIPGTNRKGEPTGKQVKQKRALPRGLSEHDAKVLMGVRRRVHHLDWSLFTIFGVGFGWSTVIGIIPGYVFCQAPSDTPCRAKHLLISGNRIGDAIDGLMSLSVFRKCCKVEGGLPASVKLQMMVNVALDFIIGLVPGAEAIYRGNTRNALLLEDFLRERAEKNLRQSGHVPDRAHAEGSRREGQGMRQEDSSAQSNGIITSDGFVDGQPSTKKRSGRR
ncbi:PH domain protein [Metarhizium album ARSEF 1941]|uniref:PH domain protein n=1 Tax=Metarhizium album (strain ARSEF 1941) TaxID=1081103 RepID=A0A0B2X535_METAS|nr:PH domain protein [Metarhizium album ARSEF 1941]KHO00848.1 PH domain protein [Metarhizium album ARSEF 1941]